MPERISAALSGFDSLSFGHVLPYQIEGFDKKVLIFWDGQMPEQEVYRIMYELNRSWLEQNGDKPDCNGCEEWIFAGLEEAGLQFIKLYINDRKDGCK